MTPLSIKWGQEKKGWTGPLSERLDLMAPITVDDQGMSLDEQLKMFECWPDAGIRGSPAKAVDVHKNWTQWFEEHGYNRQHFTGITCQALCGNDITDHSGTVCAAANIGQKLGI